MDTVRAWLSAAGEMEQTARIVHAMAIVAAGALPLPAFNGLVLAAGYLHGAAGGFAVVYVASLLGAALGFALGRRMPPSLKRRVPAKLRDLQDAVVDGGFSTLLLLRLTPLPFGLSTLFLGSIEAIPYSRFIAATALGFLRLYANTFIGAQAHGMLSEERGSSHIERAVSIGGALACILVIGSLGRALLRRSQAVKQRAE